MQTLTYDPATGAISSTTAAGKTVTTAIDTLGRVMSYTDGSGLRTESTYNQFNQTTARVEVDTVTGSTIAPLTTTYGYDSIGRLTTQTDPQAGVLTLSYDAAGNRTKQVRASAPGQLTSTSEFDVLGAETQRVWTMTGQADPVLSELALFDIHGQLVDQTMMPGGHRDYQYDGTGRLTAVTDLDAGTCAVRGYRLDIDSNRTGSSSVRAAATADPGGDPTVCPAPSTAYTSSAFDTGDRLIDSGYTYDPFGRTLRLPMPGGQVMSVTYTATDMVANQTLFANAADADSGGGAVPISSSTSTLDSTGQRFSNRSNSAGGGAAVATVMRYGDSGDSPIWIGEGDGTTTRYVSDSAGDLCASVSIDPASSGGTPAVTWQITNMHGDVTATLPGSETEALQISRPDEFGAGTEQPRYGWLGAEQRAGDTAASGTYFMGVRLYNANTGRFLSKDPVYGGNANDYVYPTDPIGEVDLDGRNTYPKYERYLCHWYNPGCSTARRAFAASLGWGKEQIARRAGARCFTESGLRICENTPKWVGVARGGTTWGTVFLVPGRLTTQQPRRSRLIRHEKEHVYQWRLFGANFPYLYGVLENPFNACKNYFEAKAGWADGGYNC